VVEQLRIDRPDWPLADAGKLLEALDEARFGSGAVANVLALARGAVELEPRLPGGSA
jgi:hypothetical protein